jgi:hypothetical protein
MCYERRATYCTRPAIQIFLSVCHDWCTKHLCRQVALKTKTSRYLAHERRSDEKTPPTQPFRWVAPYCWGAPFTFPAVTPSSVSRPSMLASPTHRCPAQNTPHSCWERRFAVRMSGAASVQMITFLLCQSKHCFSSMPFFLTFASTISTQPPPPLKLSRPRALRCGPPRRGFGDDFRLGTGGGGGGAVKAIRVWGPAGFFNFNLIMVGRRGKNV